MSSPTEEAAFALAQYAHKDDVDKLGRPYIEHLACVTNGTVTLAGYDEYLIAAAWLHDLVEDHGDEHSLDGLRELFPDRVVDIVEAVTRRADEPYDKFIGRVIDAGADAMVVKLADIFHNLRRDRLAKLDDETRDRLVRKYGPAQMRLLINLRWHENNRRREDDDE